jgi:hypothetical protein
MKSFKVLALTAVLGLGAFTSFAQTSTNQTTTTTTRPISTTTTTTTTPPVTTTTTITIFRMRI